MIWTTNYERPIQTRSQTLKAGLFLRISWQRQQTNQPAYCAETVERFLTEERRMSIYNMGYADGYFGHRRDISYGSHDDYIIGYEAGKNAWAKALSQLEFAS